MIRFDPLIADVPVYGMAYTSYEIWHLDDATQREDEPLEQEDELFRHGSARRWRLEF